MATLALSLLMHRPAPGRRPLDRLREWVAALRLRIGGDQGGKAQPIAGAASLREHAPAADHGVMAQPIAGVALRGHAPPATVESPRRAHRSSAI